MSWVLLTGFEPFGSLSCNPTATLVQRLNGTQLGENTVQGRVLPVSLGRLATAIETAWPVDASSPRGILALGLDVSARQLRLECRAYNQTAFDQPDNDGFRVADGTLCVGPASLASLHVAAVLGPVCARRGLPHVLSDDPGRYLCNAAYYLLLQRALRHTPAIPCGFIHVPMAFPQWPLHTAADLLAMLSSLAAVE